MKTETWKQLKVIILSDAEADNALIALWSGDTDELGLIVSRHVYKRLETAYVLTDKGNARLQGGVL